MGKKTKKLNRQQRAAAKRQMILQSEAFQEWYEARMSYYPTPRDPYRAFMIDLSLYARVHHKQVWQHRTNRMDYPPIDLPKGVPSKKRRLPPRKHIKRFKRVPKPAKPLVETPFEKELRKELGIFTEGYHLPDVRLRFEPRQTGAFYRPSLPFSSEKTIIVIPRSVTKGKKKIKGAGEQPFSTQLHEGGHHAHASYGGFYDVKGLRSKELSPLITTPYKLGGTTKQRVPKERIAWAIAKKHAKKRPAGWTPRMAWHKRFAYGTYLGITPLW